MALHIFCALKCEAEPIIDNFKLIRLNDFKLFNQNKIKPIFVLH